MKVSDVLARAWIEVQEAELPSELQQMAFREAIVLIGGSAPDAPARPASHTSKARANVRHTEMSDEGSSAASEPGQLPVSQDDFYRRLENETDVSVDKLERVFHLDGGVPQISLRTSSLGNSLADRQRAVGQLITVARVIGLNETEVAMTVVRGECERLRCNNTNINAALGKLAGITYLGPKTARKLKPKAGAERIFADLIDKLLGESSD